MDRWRDRLDSELLTQTPSDREAFAEFYRRHVSAIVSFFRQRTANAEIAFDLTAETFAAALEASARYRPMAQPATAWLFAIARHKLIDSARRGRVDDAARRRLGMGTIEISDEAIDTINHRADAAAAVEALAALPETHRRAITARIVDERDYADIARELQCSQLVVRKRVSRSLRIIRDQIEEAR
jgi:RNA polymerase sigma factor (sigma-70 family)